MKKSGKKSAKKGAKDLTAKRAAAVKGGAGEPLGTRRTLHK